MKNLLERTLQPTVEWLGRLTGMASGSTYRSLVEHSLVGVYLIQDGRFPYCNPRMGEIFGYDSNDEIIRHCTVADLVWPEDRDLVLGNIRRRVDGNIPVLQYGFRGLRKDGQMIEVEVLGSRVSYRGRPAVIGTLLDVTRERRVSRQLALYANALENTAEAVLVFDQDQRIVSINKAFRNITGYDETDSFGQTADFLRSGRHHESFYEHLWGSARNSGSWRGELWCRRKNGEVFPALVSLSLVDEKDGQPPHFVGVVNDISGYRQIEEKLDFLSHYDPLTELPNRALLRERLSESIRRADRGDTMVAVLLLDLDAFKRINESLGHEAGDAVLRSVADRLNAGLRRDETVARMGGDEFAVVKEGVRTMNAVTQAANRILALFEKPFTQDGQDIYTSASVGIGIFPQDGTSADGLLKQTDAALYEAKQRGRNLYQFASAEMNARALESLTITNALRQSLERDEFHLVFQPIVSLADGRVTGVEALLRWEHEELGSVPPERFIPVAEESGQIAAIGRWVIRRACEQAAAWHRQGLPSVSLAVNVSLHQLHQPDFVSMVAGALEDAGLEPGVLRIEITESVMMSDPEYIRDVLRSLSATGVRVAVDDFGKGYSSLSYLKLLPVNYIKIDRSFIRDLADERDNAAITRAIIAMARSLDIRLIAEGIENVDQRDLLAEAGCQEGQGFLFSEAVASEDVPALLAQDHDVAG